MIDVLCILLMTALASVVVDQADALTGIAVKQREGPGTGGGVPGPGAAHAN